jgi:hypothetical protein
MSNLKQNAEFAVYKFSLPPMIYNICIKHTRQKIGGDISPRHFLLHVIIYITLGVDQNQGGCRENKGGGGEYILRDMCACRTGFVDVVLLFTGFSTHTTHCPPPPHFLKNVPFKTSLEILAYICSTTPGDRGVRYYYYCINLSCCCCGNMRDEMCIITIVCV